MESEQRPSKIRKINHDQSGESEVPVEGQPPTGLGQQEDDSRHAESHHPPEDKVPGEGTSDQTGVQSNAAESLLPKPVETAALAASTVSSDGGQPLSKNQQKKLRKKAEWESKRDERKVQRKEKTIARRERRREVKQLAAAQESENGGTPEASSKPIYQRAAQLPVTFLIDCDFDDLMRDNERISLGSQITRSYSDNKGSSFRAHLTICSFGGKLRERFDNVLGQYTAWRGVRFLDENFLEAAEKAKEWMTAADGGVFKGMFAKYADLSPEAREELKQQGEIVYLSSESEETLTELKPYSTYIIGGLVDKNREKGICYKRARQQGVRTAKLPIGDFLDMQSRKVLTTNHVNEIMLRWLDSGDWGDAFLKVLPKRKEARLKASGDNGSEDVDGGDAEEDDEAEAGAADQNDGNVQM